MKIKAPPRFELGISCLLDRRFNQLSHGATVPVQQQRELVMLSRVGGQTAWVQGPTSYGQTMRPPNGMGPLHHLLKEHGCRDPHHMTIDRLGWGEG